MGYTLVAGSAGSIYHMAIPSLLRLTLPLGVTYDIEPADAGDQNLAQGESANPGNLKA